ncbi:allantoin permease [Mytilinidion resinicola]|uniref:Allantoin permease n=1 Tax=Mytilinidion resinicola TaxID=574789 RepID=A0A6A6Y5N4_9PEZI|nr:allantoin permease [Mytilinidion resinicola]KAF2803334.1 allantoin permease [Mytilinidion resinicola]
MAEKLEEKTGGVSQVPPSILEGQTATEKQMRDIGADLYLEVQQYSREELEAERKVVLRKIDWVIMPIICVTYTIQFLDKLSLNYASAYSLLEDLDLVGQRYSWVASIFNFGYLFWAIPANLLVQRLPVAKYTGSMILIWSVLLCCHAATSNYAGILVLRFLLGMFEASISPAIMNICSMFYTRSEQPLRMCVFLAFNGMATMVGALLGYGLGHTHSSTISSWKLIFLVIGLMNFVWSWVFLWFMPDSPSTAKFLTHKQRVIAIDRIAENMIGVKTKQFQPKQVVEALLDIKVHCLMLIGLACGVINGGVSNFSSALIKGFGFSGIYATLLQLPTGAFEFFFVPLCGLAASYFKNTRCIILAIICLPPLGGLIGIRLTSLDHRWSLVGCTWLQYMVGAPVILSWNLLTSNIAGHTKRSIANGLWFCFYAGGNIAGAQIFFAREKPRYFSALTGLIVSYCGMVVIAVFLRFYMMWENRRRDKLMGPGERTANGADEQAILEGFKDVTDKESSHFRYCL